MLFCAACSNSSSNDDTFGGAEISGTITAPATITNRCYLIKLDTDSDTTNGQTRLDSGMITGTTFNYRFTNISAGSYYLSAFVDLDSDCTAIHESGDYFGWHGSNNTNAPTSGTVTLENGLQYDYDVTLYTVP